MEDDFSLPPWLHWAREIAALAQTGLAFSQTIYEEERNRRLMAIAADMFAACTTEPLHVIRQSLALGEGYATPKIDVRGAMLREGRVLLVREASDGRWCLPGGWVDVGDRPVEAVVREVREESGYRVQATKLIGVFDANRDGRPLALYHAFKLIFLCEIIGGEPRTSHETVAVDFFPIDHPPPLSLNRTHPRHLDEIRRHVEDPLRPTYFE